MQLKVTISVHRDPYGVVWYTVKTDEGDFGIGDTLQNALDSLGHDLPREET